MDRRSFIKTVAATAAAAPAAMACPACLESKQPYSAHRWPYIVYCYEREQGEWIFSENVRGSFDYQNEYKTFDEESWDTYCGFMYDGKLHFYDLERATDFIEMHVRTKDDTNIIDTIYDVYYENEEGTEIQVAHYWYNGDTGNQIHWVSNQPRSATDWCKVECS